MSVDAYAIAISPHEWYKLNAVDYDQVGMREEEEGGKEGRKKEEQQEEQEEKERRRRGGGEKERRRREERRREEKRRRREGREKFHRLTKFNHCEPIFQYAKEY